MKKKNIILLFLMVLAGVGCHKDTDPAAESPEVRNVKVNPSQTGAGFVWNVVDMPGKFQTGVEVSGHENMSDPKSLPAYENDDRFVASIDSLTPNTTYYYRIVVWNRFKRFEFPQGNGTAFTTSETPTPPGQDTTSYTITVSVNLAEGGTASGGGRFAEGDTCTVTATANEGYVFVNWTEEGISVADSVEYSFEVRHDRHLVANFVVESAVLYTVTTQAEPEEGGRVTGGGNYEEGTEIELTATANLGYTFERWHDGNTDNPRHITVMADTTYTAYFTRDEYKITVLCQPENGGTATVNNDGQFHYNETATLTATANDGYEFAGWDDGNTDNPRGVTVTGDATYTAVFSEVGTINYNVIIHVEPEGAGTVTGGGPHEAGSQIELNATPSEGYAFEKWGDGSTANPRPITVNADMELTAIFKKNTYTVSVQATIGGTAHIGEMTNTIEATFEHGDRCWVHAIAGEGYGFEKWTEGGVNVSNRADYDFVVTEAHNLTANFMQEYNYIHLNIVVSIQDGSSAEGTMVSFLNLNPQEQQSHPVSPIILDGTGFYEVYDFPVGNYRISVSKTGYESIVEDYDIYVDMNLRFDLSPYTIVTPTGAINGKFTINANGDQVFFSQGNLQYRASTNTWRFAENQYDYVGNANSNISQTYSGWIDLFGWGTSGWNSGNTYYHPWDSDNSDGSLYGPLGEYNLTGTYANADWGVYNAIYNGGEQAGQWRTLTHAEWEWVMGVRSPNPGVNCRTSSTVNGTPNARYVKALVAGVHGVIAFPDSYTHPSGVAQPVGINETGNAGWNGNDYSATDFASMQDAGAVFLPAAGIRSETSVFNVGSRGHYWSASYYNSRSAYDVDFDDMYLSTDGYYIGRIYGHSVRLVCPAEN